MLVGFGSFLVPGWVRFAVSAFVANFLVPIRSL